MPKKEVPKKYYYFATVTYKNGDVRPYRFKNKNYRRNAVAAFERDQNVKNVRVSEGYADE